MLEKDSRSALELAHLQQLQSPRPWVSAHSGRAAYAPRRRGHSPVGNGTRSIRSISERSHREIDPDLTLALLSSHQAEWTIACGSSDPDDTGCTSNSAYRGDVDRRPSTASSCMHTAILTRSGTPPSSESVLREFFVSLLERHDLLERRPPEPASSETGSPGAIELGVTALRRHDHPRELRPWRARRRVDARDPRRAPLQRQVRARCWTAIHRRRNRAKTPPSTSARAPIGGRQRPSRRPLTGMERVGRRSR